MLGMNINQAERADAAPLSLVPGLQGVQRSFYPAGQAISHRIATLRRQRSARLPPPAFPAFPWPSGAGMLIALCPTRNREERTWRTKLLR